MDALTIRLDDLIAARDKDRAAHAPEGPPPDAKPKARRRVVLEYVADATRDSRLGALLVDAGALLGYALWLAWRALAWVARAIASPFRRRGRP